MMFETLIAAILLHREAVFWKAVRYSPFNPCCFLLHAKPHPNEEFCCLSQERAPSLYALCFEFS